MLNFIAGFVGLVHDKDALSWGTWAEEGAGESRHAQGHGQAQRTPASLWEDRTTQATCSQVYMYISDCLGCAVLLCLVCLLYNIMHWYFSYISIDMHWYCICMHCRYNWFWSILKFVDGGHIKMFAHLMYVYMHLSDWCCVHAYRDYILDLLEGGRKLIVFAHHRSVLDSVCECLHSKVSRQGEAVMHSEINIP